MRALPHRLGHRVPVGREAALGMRVHEVRARPAEQRRALVDLVERVRAHDPRIGLGGVDHGLGDREQRLAAAEHGDHLALGVEGRAVAALDPARERRAQLRQAARGGIARQAAQVRGERFPDERGRRMLRLAEPEAHGRDPRGRGNVGQQRAQPLEGIGLQQPEPGIHPAIIGERSPSPGLARDEASGESGESGGVKAGPPRAGDRRSIGRCRCGARHIALADSFCIVVPGSSASPLPRETRLHPARREHRGHGANTEAGTNGRGAASPAAPQSSRPSRTNGRRSHQRHPRGRGGSRSGPAASGSRCARAASSSATRLARPARWSCISRSSRITLP